MISCWPLLSRAAASPSIPQMAMDSIAFYYLLPANEERSRITPCMRPTLRRFRFRPNTHLQVTRINVRFGSEAGICAAKSHVRFTRERDIRCVLNCLLWAISGHQERPTSSFRELYALCLETGRKVGGLAYLLRQGYDVAQRHWFTEEGP